MSTRYTVQNNLKGYWADWQAFNSLNNAITTCQIMIEGPVENIDDICSWRVIKEETVQIYPRNEVLHEQH